MATTLPPIPGAAMAGNGAMSNVTRSSGMHHYNAPRPPIVSNNKQFLRPIQKVQGKKDRELQIKREHLRSQQPLLTKAQTSEYRNSYKHNLCLDMLQDGFHKSYQELYALMRRQQNEREAAGPESLLWTLPQLHDQYEKLDTLKHHLTAAELASRKDDFSSVYTARFELAKYFQRTHDKWLVDHFFNSCLAVSSYIADDGGKMLAQGHCNVGVAFEENGDYLDAVSHFEEYYKLSSENGDWVGKDGVALLTDACIKMYNIYTTIGNHLETEDPEQSLSNFQKAYTMSKESGDRKLAGEAAFRLGLAYQKNDDAETALQHLKSFLEVCRMTGNHDGEGRACDAIAQAYKQQGNIEECLHYVQMFVDVAEKNQQEKAYSKACHNLGAIYNALGRYEEATECFSKAYNLSRAHNDPGSISLNRVQFGISLAHKMLLGFSSHVVNENRACLERLGDWKSSRADQLVGGLPEPDLEGDTGETEGPFETQNEVIAEEDESNQTLESTENNQAEENENKEENIGIEETEET